jgi:hypothetical protein
VQRDPEQQPVGDMDIHWGDENCHKMGLKNPSGYVFPGVLSLNNKFWADFRFIERERSYSRWLKTTGYTASPLPGF